VFPNKFGQRFIDLGIDPNNVEYGAWWETTSHEQKAREYDRVWEEFLASNPSVEEVRVCGRTLAAYYGFEVHF